MNSPLRVAYILKMFPRLSETFILHEILELERQGVEVSVFSLMHPADGRFHGRLSELKLSIDYLPRDKPEVYWDQLRQSPDDVPAMPTWERVADRFRRWQVPKDLELLMRTVRIATEVQRRGIQHVHSHFATVAARVACGVHDLTGVPFSFTSHAKDIYRETVDRDAYSELLDRSAFNITVCDYNRDFILANTPRCDPAKVVRLYNGVDLNAFRRNGAAAADDTFHIVSVGRLVPKKGFDVLLRALGWLRDQGVEFRATVAGDGPEGPALEELRRALSLEDRVTFLGAVPQERVRELCAEASVMALACVADQDGNQDALPTVLLEALALGVPLVSTRVSGVPEIIGDEAGAVVEPGEDAAFAAALLDVRERRRSGELDAAMLRRRAETLFDLSKNVAELHQRFRRSAERAASA